MSYYKKYLKYKQKYIDLKNQLGGSNDNGFNYKTSMNNNNNITILLDYSDIYDIKESEGDVYTDRLIMISKYIFLNKFESLDLFMNYFFYDIDIKNFSQTYTLTITIKNNRFIIIIKEIINYFKLLSNKSKINTRIKELENEIENQKKEKGDLDKQKEDLKKQKEDLKINKSEINTRIKELENKIQNQKKEKEDLEKQKEDLKKQKEELENKIQNQKKEKEDLEKQKTIISKILNIYNNIQTNIDNIQTNIDNIQINIDNIQTKIDNLSETGTLDFYFDNPSNTEKIIDGKYNIKSLTNMDNFKCLLVLNHINKVNSS